MPLTIDGMRKAKLEQAAGALTHTTIITPYWESYPRSETVHLVQPAQTKLSVVESRRLVSRPNHIERQRSKMYETACSQPDRLFLLGCEWICFFK